MEVDGDKSEEGRLRPHHVSFINTVGKFLLFLAAFAALYMTIKACIAKRKEEHQQRVMRGEVPIGLEDDL
jgi:hypothetical protein